MLYLVKLRQPNLPLWTVNSPIRSITHLTHPFNVKINYSLLNKSKSAFFLLTHIKLAKCQYYILSTQHTLSCHLKPKYEK